MKITLESTSRIVSIKSETSIVDRAGIRHRQHMECRVWEGQTVTGVKVICLIPRIAAVNEGDLTEFEKELKEMSPPSPDVEAFPQKMIIYLQGF